MNKLDAQYGRLIARVMQKGIYKKDRTGVGTMSVTGAVISHDMADGFPVLTTKKLYFKTMSIELEGFLKGITDKAWYKERGCNIWNQWCRPDVIPSNLDGAEKELFQLMEDDLGPIYGSQWNNFNGEGYNQLRRLNYLIAKEPTSRRMVVSAWNPNRLHQQALPPCHITWQVIINGNKLDLIWYQRSADVFLGLPFDIAEYGLLLSLLAKQHGYAPGMLIGYLGDTHIYTNHQSAIMTQLSRMRNAYNLPTLFIKDEFIDIESFDHTMVALEDYEHWPAISAPIAI